jgi:hypothetical protein
MLHNDANIVRTGNDNGNKARLYAMLAVLMNFKFDRSSFAVFIIHTSDGPEFFMIDEATIHLMKKIINAAFYGGDDPFMSVEKSDYAFHFKENDWVQMEIRYHPDSGADEDRGWLNYLDNRPSQTEPQVRVPKKQRRRGGGLFPYVLLRTDLNLWRFGIYNFASTAPGINCLVHAVSEADIMEPEDVALLEWIIKTATIPFTALSKIATFFGLCIRLSKWDNAREMVGKRVTYGCKKDPELNLFTRDGHIMLMEKTTALGGKPIWISTALKRLFKQGAFRPMGCVEMNLALRQQMHTQDLRADVVSKHCVDDYTTAVKTTFCTDFKKILDTDEIKAMNQRMVTQLMMEFDKVINQNFHIFASNYRSLASLGQAILYQTKCYKGVPLLCGPVAEFIRKCQAPPLVQARDNRPIYVEGKLVQLDRRGSYCAVYTEFKGIPMGRPVKMTEFEPDKWNYFYICVDIKSIYLKYGFDEGFPLIKGTGRAYLDKTMFEAIGKRYEWEYQWVSGYGFDKGFNMRIKDVAMKLWIIRMELKAQNSPLQAVMKRMINTLFGKSIARERLTYTTNVTADVLMRCLSRRPNFIFSFKKQGDEYQVKWVEPLVINWTHPQFGVNVLTWSRAMMIRHIDNVRAVCGSVYYVNTDCLVMNKEVAEQLNDNWPFIGQELGQFSDELPMPAVKFISLSQRSYMFSFPNGRVKVRNGPTHGEDPNEWFEERWHVPKSR